MLLFWPGGLFAQDFLLTDPTRNLSPVAAIAASGYRPLSEGPLTLEAGATYWLRRTLTNPTDATIERWLHANTSDLYDARLYLAGDNGIEVIRSPSNQKTKSFLVRLSPCTNLVTYLYLDRRFLPVTLSVGELDSTAFLRWRDRMAFTGGLYTGAGLLYLLLACLQILFLRSRESLYFFLYVAGSMVYLFYSRSLTLPGWLDSIGLRYLFDTLPYISVAVSTIGYLGLFHLVFHLPPTSFLSRAVAGLQVGCALLVGLLLFWPWIVDIWFYGYLTLVQGLAVVSLSGLSCILLGGSWLYVRRGVPDQGLFLLTFLPVLLLVICIWFMEGGLLPRMAFVYNDAPGLTIFYESSLLGGLLIYRHLRERTRLRRLISTQRREIIHDLHSGLLPEIDAVRELNERSIRPLQPHVHARLTQLTTEISEAVRALMWTLGRSRDEPLDELVGRLRGKVSSRFADLPCQATFTTIPTIIPPDIPVSFFTSYHLYHTVKEVTNNAAKHAEADHFDCTLRYANGGLVLSMTDDGKGSTHHPDVPASGHGLAELRQRTEKIGATCAYSSEVGRGTTVRITLSDLRGK